ncbi:MAG: two-component regulator propeller domain-containing protein [Bacteroidota bacterium]
MAIFEDRSGVLWVATGKKLFKWPKKAQKVDLVGSIPSAFGQDVVTSILIDKKDNLWVGTRKGLWLYPSNQNSEKKDQWHHFLPQKNNPKTLRNSIVYSLFEDSNGIIWVATYGGLHYLLPDDVGPTAVFHRLTMKDGLSTNFIYHISEIEENDYWIATYTSLMRMKFNPFTPKSLPKFSIYENNQQDSTSIVNSTCYEVAKDRFGQYWVATYDGLSKIIDNGHHVDFENYINKIADSSSLVHNTVGTLHLDKQGRLWVGTRMGLHLAVQTGADNPVTFIHYGLEEGFRNEVIQSITEDNAGNLWIGSNDGLTYFSPELASKGEKAVLLTLSVQDGLPSNGFAPRAAISSNDGNNYFGSASGLIAVAYNQIPINYYQPPVALTSVKVNNIPLCKLKSEYSDFQTIAIPKALDLSYHENTLELNFAALDYTRPKSNRYQYQLEGFDEDWVNLSTRTTTTFTKLPPGQYTFRVKGANNDGVWSTNVLELPIYIAPPFWRTWWAYTMYGLLTTGLVMIIFRWRLKSRLSIFEQRAQLASARFEEREMLRRKNAADFHDEIGHRMTKISLLLELASRQAEDKHAIQPFLTKVRHHTNSLSEGIRDLIWGLDPEKDNLFQTLLRLQEFGDRLFEYTNIHFRTEGINVSLEQIPLSLEMKKHLLFLFKEAMNNTLKHAQAQQATFSLHESGQQFIFTFLDNGNGINSNELTTTPGYGIGNMNLRAEKLGGELFIDGNSISGTIIRLTVELPFTKERRSNEAWLKI